jgi:hypothetical protein
MKERPILFSAPMVRAILSGNKTQTRRVMKHQVCEPGIVEIDSDGYCMIVEDNGVKIQGWHCPYGKPGDHLWVRETFAYCVLGTDMCDESHSHSIPAKQYEKDCKSLNTYHIAYAADPDEEAIIGPWRPSIHMPRHASRITLEIISVRVERLNDISEEDAIAEGIDESKSDSAISQGWYERPRRAFMRLWESINGAGSWAKNPWVWVIEFKRVKPC